MLVEFVCEICEKPVRKQWSAGMSGKPRYCSIACKSEAQRRTKPVDRDWLYQKYVVEELDCTAIAKLVGRNSKRVWEWLRDYDIPTRPRGSVVAQQFQPGHTICQGRVLSEDTREKMRQARIREGSVPYLKNGVHHLKGKRGADTPNWKGGITPQRQSVYGSLEWKAAVKAVWKRDNATCQRCKKHHNTAQNRGTFDIHHIVSFEVVALRCVVSNLVLLCQDCHYWVHSNENSAKEFLK
jgi:hypothetical protein